MTITEQAACLTIPRSLLMPLKRSAPAMRVLWLLALAMLCSMGLLTAQGPSPVVEGPFPAMEGETCVVCNGAVTNADIAYVVDGQRVAMKRSLEAEFLSNPLRYTRNTRPEGMLFSGYSRPTPNWTLFLAGLWVLGGLLFGSLSAQLALSKGMPAVPWFFAGFVANVFAWGMLRARPSAAVVIMPPGLEKVPTTAEPAACPACGSSNHPRARRCLQCGVALTPAGTSEADRIRQQEKADV